MSLKHDMIAVIGPTASGKTEFAAHLAKRVNGEVISADSRQVYKHMDIGTGKDMESYVVEGTVIPVHLTDIVEPGYKYSVFEYQRDFDKVYASLKQKGRMPVLCGGSGMYIDAVTRRYRLENVPVNENLRNELSSRNMDELRDILSEYKKLHNNTDTDTREHALRAIEIEVHYGRNPNEKRQGQIPRTLFIGIMYDRETERQRITERLKSRLENGLVEEVSSLLQSGIPAESLTYYGLEYRFVTHYLRGEIDYHNMFTRLNIAIHQFAKRQRTWFRKMEKEGINIVWLDGKMPMDEKLQKVLALT